MKRIINLFLLLSLGAFFANAETVSQKYAQQIAQIFFNKVTEKTVAPPKLVYNGKRLTTDRLFTPFYVYNSSAGGFVIIAAENKAYPILGYSLKDNFDPDGLREGEKALLKSYAREIEFIRYDSSPVDSVISAWQNIDNFIETIIKGRYIATDPDITTEEALKQIEDAIERDAASYSDIYTPEQWRETVLEDLKIKNSIPIAIEEEGKLFPMVIYGYKGPYFRIEMTTRNNWLMRLNATDIIPSAMITSISPLNEDFFEEVTPFEEHDNFLIEVANIEAQRASIPSIDIPLIADDPVVRSNGGGHFEILLPEEIAMTTIYNISGAMLSRQTYSDSMNVNIDISKEPAGFYIVNLIGESGKSYGLKLFR